MIDTDFFGAGKEDHLHRFADENYNDVNTRGGDDAQDNAPAHGRKEHFKRGGRGGDRGRGGNNSGYRGGGDRGAYRGRDRFVNREAAFNFRSKGEQDEQGGEDHSNYPPSNNYQRHKQDDFEDSNAEDGRYSGSWTRRSGGRGGGRGRGRNYGGKQGQIDEQVHHDAKKDEEHHHHPFEGQQQWRDGFRSNEGYRGRNEMRERRQPYSKDDGHAEGRISYVHKEENEESHNQVPPQGSQKQTSVESLAAEIKSHCPAHENNKCESHEEYGQTHQERPHVPQGRTFGDRKNEIHNANAASKLRPGDSELTRPGRTQRVPRLRTNNYEDSYVDALFSKHHKQTGISFDNYDRIDVDLAPGDVKPVLNFNELDVSPLLARNIERCGYVKPTPVQKYGIPVGLAGGDLLACAQTGSGKTAAFLIPSIQHIIVNGVSPAKNYASHPIALVFAPVRELAIQIEDETKKLSHNTDIWVSACYGGMDYPSRFEQDILVACPGRLKDMFEKEKVSFDRVKFLVFDEADRMLEMGFEESIRYMCMSKMTDMTPLEERQTLMFSATFPTSIRDLARSYLRRKHYLLTVGRVGSTTSNITQVLLQVESRKKDDQLLEILYKQATTDLVLIFCETKNCARDLCYMLNNEGIPCDTIHGDRQQSERIAALSLFKSGEKPILVATDVASRGLDIPNVTHVIQYDLPKTIDDYTHRIGRTGRAGNKGIATSFFCRQDYNLAKELEAYLKEHKQFIPDWMQEVLEDISAESFNQQGRSGRSGRSGVGRGKRRGAGADNDWESYEVKPTSTRTNVKEYVADYNDGGF